MPSYPANFSAWASLQYSYARISILRLTGIGTWFLAFYVETKTCFILETNVIFLTTSCNDTWFFSASNYVWFLIFILCSTKIGRFSLPWQSHALKIEPTSYCEMPGTRSLSRVESRVAGAVQLYIWVTRWPLVRRSSPGTNPSFRHLMGWEVSQAYHTQPISRGSSQLSTD